jgi:hypothetical protein
MIKERSEENNLTDNKRKKKRLFEISLTVRNLFLISSNPISKSLASKALN